MAEVMDFDLDRRAVRVQPVAGENEPILIRYEGNVTTIGRCRRCQGAESEGFAWLVWLVIHIRYLIGFQNRILVLTRWSFSFFTRGRGGRAIENLGEPSEPPDRGEIGTRPPRD